MNELTLIADNISAFLKHPLMILLSNGLKHPFFLVLFGGLFLKIITDRKIRQFQYSDKRIECLDSNAKALNRVFPLLFNFIRNIELSDDEIKKLDEAIMLLFQEIISLKVKSYVYFGNSTYSKRYEQLCWQIEQLFQILKSLNRKGHKYESTSSNKITNEIDLVDKKIFELQTNWPFDMKNYVDHIEKIKDPNCLKFYTLGNMLWGRAINSQITALNKASIS